MKKFASVKLHIRVLCAVLVILLTIGVLPAKAAVSGGATEDSILYNGSFSLANLTSQSVQGWNLNAGNANHKVTVQKNIARSNNALKIQATGRSYIYATEFSVESGETYILSYWVRVDAAENLQFAPFLNDSSYSGGWWLDYAVKPVQSVTDGWVKVSGTVTIPDSVGANPRNPSGKIQLGMMVYQGSGTLYLDDVSIVKVQINQNDPNLHFEQVDTAANQPINWSTKASGVAVGGDGNVYHDGSRSMKLTVNSLAEKSTVSSAVLLTLKPGMIYEYSFWMCSRNASPTATIRMDLQLFGSDGLALTGDDATLQGTTAALNGGTQRSGWTKVVTRVAVPEGAAYGSIRFLLTRGSAEIWIDDIFCEIVEDGTDCVVYYEDFHAVDESGSISSWKLQGNGSFTAENGGKLTVNSGEGYIYDTLECLATDYTYCIKGDYTANMGGTVQVRFYDYQHKEYEDARQTVPLMAGGTAFAVNFTAPSHTYAAIYIGSDQVGTVTVEDVTVYMTAQPPKPNPNYLDADWTKKADRDNVVSSVEIYNGIPTLMIDGQPTASYFYLRPDLDAYLQTDAESRIGSSGLELYVTYGGSLYKGGCAPIWLEDGTIDYAAFDAVIYDTLAASDDALVMVNIGMFAPKWWLEQNPDHRAQAHNGSSYIPLDDASLGSEKFRQEAGTVLRSLLAHMKEQNYYNRVFGIKISGGQSYEWMHLGTGVDQGPDYSAASQEGFKTYLKKKYGTDAALQAAWGNNQVTLETAAAPGWDARCASSNVYLGDADTGALSRNMVDWNLYLNESSADSFLYYCQIAKEVTENQIIVGGYNGYLWTSNSYDSQGMAHTAMDRVLDSEYVDWIASPIAYNERLLGQSSTYMALLDSVQAHGKLYIAEQDNRTCLSDTYAGKSWDAEWDYKIGQTRTMADTIYQQKRDFANALVNGAGLWQFDMYGGWLDDDQIYDYFRDAKAEYDLSVHLNRNTVNEVAVFVGDETYGYLTAENSNMSYTLLEPMLMQQRKHLAAMGAGYDTYAMSTLLEGKVPSHKLNIILSPFEITEQMQTAIDTHLKTNGQVVVWVYLPGISTGTELSLSNVERTTGFSVGAKETKSTLQVKLADTSHQLTSGIAGLTYGNSVTNSVSPLTYIKDTTGITVLGYNLSDGMPGLAVKDMGNWTSVYSAAPCLDVQLLRNLLKFAGCHSYSENSADIIYSSNHYVALHSAAAGEKTLRLPGNYSVYDVFEKKFLSMNTNVITYYHEADDTHIFRLMSPNTYAVTADIEKGKGSLSQSGLTAVTPGQGYTLQITPEYGYVTETVTVNGTQTQIGGDGILSLSAITENTVISVSFRRLELVENGGFETGSIGGNMTGNGTVVSDSTVHSGLYSLRLNHDGTARDLVQMDIHLNSVPRNREITVTFWAKTMTGAKTRTINTAGYCFYGDYSGTQTQYGAKYPERDGLWRQYTETYTLPAGYELFEFLLYTGESGTDVYIDDISISCEGTEMMVNGGLERGNFTGSYTKMENTPTLIKTNLRHGGDYGLKLAKNGSLTTAVPQVTIDQNARLSLSVWLRALGSNYKVNYRILDGETVISQGDWTLSSQWQEQTMVCPIYGQPKNLKIELVSKNGTVYADDLSVRVLPPVEPEKAQITFLEVYSDGTWRFAVSDINLFTESYYQIPVVIDGVQGYAVAHKISGMLCIYPSFFSIYGGKVPSYSLTIPADAILRPVDSANGWEVLENKAVLKNKTALDIRLAEGDIAWWNVSLGGDLTANFYGKIQAQKPENAEVVITVADQTKKFTLADGVYDAQKEAYRFSMPLAAAQMTDDISVRLTYSGVILFEKHYTVREYADALLADESQKDYHQLVRQMLCYGGAAQTYFDYQTDRLASSGITDEMHASLPAQWEMTQNGKADGVRFYGASLLFRNQVSVRYYFAITGEVESYTFTAGGISYTPVAQGELYYVELPGINPQDWDQEILLTVGDLQIGYSPMNYMVRMQEKGSDSLKTLLNAMYHYHLAAKEWTADS